MSWYHDEMNEMQDEIDELKSKLAACEVDRDRYKAKWDNELLAVMKPKPIF